MVINAAQRQIELSIVIPAYNELARLPSHLDLIRAHCQAVLKRPYEVVVVDDGSTDGLGDHLQSVAASWDALSVVRHATNLGKGAAIRTGVLRSAGELLLFTDADGATPIEEEQKLRLAIQGGADVAVGSRVGHGGATHSSRGWGRALPAWAFRRIIQRYLAIPIADTQCGFKMFRGDIGRRLFLACSEEGYLVDLFVLRLALRLGYTIEEVPVEWHEVAGSKMRLVRDSYAMWRGLRRLDHRVSRAIRAMDAKSPLPLVEDSPWRGEG